LKQKYKHHSRFQELADTVNSRLDENVQTNTSTTSNTSSNGYFVKVTASALNIRNGAGTNNSIVGYIRDKGIYTIVETSGNWGKLKSGAGWICLDYTEKVNSSGKVATKPTLFWVRVDKAKACVRNKPNSKTGALAGSRYLYRGTTFQASGTVIGENVSGNNIWYKSWKGNYVWSGGLTRI